MISCSFGVGSDLRRFTFAELHWSITFLAVSLFDLSRHEKAFRAVTDVQDRNPAKAYAESWIFFETADYADAANGFLAGV
jgi:hypothetical protein